ncbi:hypothetical protein K438DRAFT_648761 [Mycena galopus ATCC 62051]|nr:hypothetical protein K438DRAFT_648761 [Mycena galopus ATCC 62051]
MGRFSDVIRLIPKTKHIVSGSEPFFLHPYIFRAHTLHHINRHQEVLQLLMKGVVTGSRRYWTDNGEVFQFQLYFLHTELAAVQNHLGHQEKALKTAEQTVAACRKEVHNNFHILEQQKCILIHSLTTLANCLAKIGRNIEALTVAQEAVLIYTENAPHMWGHFRYTIRKEEFGVNAFHALSLQLLMFGKPEQALLNAKKAEKLYRELVVLAPRHLPTLANNLQNQASILWDLTCQDEAITACKEAVNIMRKVVDLEMYFLSALAKALAHLVCYLTEKGDSGSMSAIITECADIQRKITSLPSQPNYVFEKAEWDDESKAWETYSILALSTTQSLGGNTHFMSKLGIPEATIIPRGVVIGSLKEAPISPNATVVTSVVAPEDPLNTVKNTAISTKNYFMDVFNKPLEVRLSSTLALMNILWWILLGILFSIVWSSTCF